MILWLSLIHICYSGCKITGSSSARFHCGCGIFLYGTSSRYSTSHYEAFNYQEGAFGRYGPASVSYTHLDVYKRQVLSVPMVRRLRARSLNGLGLGCGIWFAAAFGASLFSGAVGGVSQNRGFWLAVPAILISLYAVGLFESHLMRKGELDEDELGTENPGGSGTNLPAEGR